MSPIHKMFFLKGIIVTGAQVGYCKFQLEQKGRYPVPPSFFERTYQDSAPNDRKHELKHSYASSRREKRAQHQRFCQLIAKLVLPVSTRPQGKYKCGKTSDVEHYSCLLYYMRGQIISLSKYIGDPFPISFLPCFPISPNIVVTTVLILLEPSWLPTSLLQLSCLQKFNIGFNQHSFHSSKHHVQVWH